MSAPDRVPFRCQVCDRVTYAPPTVTFLECGYCSTATNWPLKWLDLVAMLAGAAALVVAYL